MKFKSLYLKILGFLPGPIKAPLLRRGYRHDPLPFDIVFKLAETRDEYAQAFQILHDCFVDCGYMKPEKTGLRVTKYHLHPNTSVLIGKIKNEVITTLSVIADSSVGLPLEKSWDISFLRSRGNRIAEISALAVKPDYRFKKGQVLFPLFKYMREFALNYMGVETIAVSTLASVKDFYCHVLLFQPIENLKVKRYSFVNGASAVAQYLDLDSKETHDSLKKVYSGTNNDLYNYFFNEVSSQFRFPGPNSAKCIWSVHGPEEIQFFLHCLSSLADDMTIEEREKIALAYPDLDYRKVIMGEGVDPAKAVSWKFFSPLEPRFQAKSQLKVFIHDRTFQGSLRNASLSGFQALFAEPVSIGHTVNCIIKRSMYPEFLIRGQVIWSKNKLYGLKIVGPRHGNWGQLVYELGSSFRSASKEKRLEISRLKSG